MNSSLFVLHLNLFRLQNSYESILIIALMPMLRIIGQKCNGCNTRIFAK